MNLRRVSTAFLLVCICALTLGAQPKYRTFSQTELSQKKYRLAGKFTSNIMRYTFRNDTGVPVDGIEVPFNSVILNIVDSAGFPLINFGGIPKVFHALGKTVPPGDSVTIALHFDKRRVPKMYPWLWFASGAQVGPTQAPVPGAFQPVYNPPNGGNVLEYIYKKLVTRPAGVVIGKAGTPGGGWVRYMKADRDYFPATGTIFCFSFTGEIKNPKIRKVNNSLASELHALRLAVIANDARMTEPDTPATRLGDLVYDDILNPADPFNGLTIRTIMAYADSGLTVCSPDETLRIESFVHIQRITQAFLGEYSAVSWAPFVLAGARELPDFLHPNPAAQPLAVRGERAPFFDVGSPGEFRLSQNYPNPFNPTTTLEFQLAEEAVVSIKVFNTLGQDVATLASAEEFSEGENSVEFDGSNLASGFYFYRIEAASADGQRTLFSAVKKMLLLR